MEDDEIKKVIEEIKELIRKGEADDENFWN